MKAEKMTIKRVRKMKKTLQEETRRVKLSYGDLFGLGYTMFNNSSKMWFIKRDLCTYFGVSQEKLRDALEDSQICVEVCVFSTHEIVRLFNESIKESGVPMKSVHRFEEFHGLETVFFILYTLGVNTKPVVLMRKYFNQVFSDLIYDGFASLYNWNCELNIRRAIASKICGTEHYKDIMEQRFDPSHHALGSLVHTSKAIIGNEANPDVYITRDETTQIKKVDQAISHLSEVFNLSEEKLLEMLCINPQSGIMTPELEIHLREVVKERLHAIE